MTFTKALKIYRQNQHAAKDIFVLYEGYSFHLKDGLFYDMKERPVEFSPQDEQSDQWGVDIDGRVIL